MRTSRHKSAQLFLKSVQSRAKIDKRHAQGLALYGLYCGLRPYPLKSAGPLCADIKNSINC